MAEWLDKPQVIVRVATLDEDPGVVPVAHIWTSHDVEWLQTEGLPKHAEWAN
jgi:ADP-ribosyl-[dinitrogen reductase] hydrolase